jgi:predicted component of type VI protein secretion system
MRPVRISVEHPPSHGGVAEHEFTVSPIQLGRNPMADLRLPYEFVSSWHGLIRFDDVSASYFDLGSTNGTEFEGRRIGPGQEVPFDGPVQVRIADLTLTLSRAGAPAQLEPPLMSPPFMSPDSMSPDSMSPPVMSSPSAPRLSTRVMSPRRMRSPASHDEGLTLIRELGQRLLPSAAPPDTPEAAELLLDRIARLLETCARGVVEMQAGQERIGQEMGVQAVKHYTGLRFANSAQAALEYLLADLGPDDHRRLDELSVAFADSMSHQVAMLNGVVAGARAIVDALDPGAIERETAVGRIGRFRELWAAFTARWERLAANDKRLMTVLFGPEFGRVYAEVGGELSASWRRNEDGNARDDSDGTTRAP